jgi:signal transduction histidine kinase
MLQAIEESQSGLKESEAYKAGLIEQLKEAVRSRDEFISIASHELRTPITPLKLQLQLLQRLLSSEAFAGNEKAPLLKDLIAPADRQIERLTKLVDNLLDVSRITSGLFKLNPEVMDLTQFLNEIIEQYRPEMEKLGCELELNLAPSVIVNWDRLRIEQVIVNLITNAMKYGIGKPISIGLGTEREQAILTVRDHGIGIAERDRERIFERFERAVSSESYGGLGLGLYISKQIVIAHHGQIQVESVLGEGTTVIVKIPLGQEAP